MTSMQERFYEGVSSETRDFIRALSLWRQGAGSANSVGLSDGFFFSMGKVGKNIS